MVSKRNQTNSAIENAVRSVQPTSYGGIVEDDSFFDSIEAPNNAIVLNPDDTYQFRRWKMTSIDLSVPDSVTRDELRDFGEMLGGLEGASSWWKGLFANIFVEGIKDDFERGLIYDEVADEFNMDKKTLRNCAVVCRFFADPSQRWDGLFFSHHLVASGRDDAQELLALAYENGWSVSQLRSHMSSGKKRPAITRFREDSLPSLERQLRRLKGKSFQSAIQDVEAMLERLRSD